MELPLQPEELLRQITQQRKVSILVLMELPLQPLLSSISLLSKCEVSILVLMELPLQLPIKTIDIIIMRSFNPCFNGTTSATQTSAKKL